MKDLGLSYLAFIPSPGRLADVEGRVPPPTGDAALHGP